MLFKKNLRSLLFIVLFFSIINSNLFGKCSNYSKKDNNNDNNNTTNVDPKKDDNNPDPNKDNPQNPPTQNPPQSDNIEKNNIISQCENLLTEIKKLKNDYSKTINKDDTIENLKILKTQLETDLNNLKNKKPDVDTGKDPSKDNNEITEIQPIDFSKIPVQDIEEKYDTTGININFINKDNFFFKSTKFSYKDGNKLDDKDFTILENLIKNFLAKKELKGNFTIDYIKPEHLGVNPILRIKITNDDLKTTFCAFIKNELCNLLMFKLFQIVDLLPFEYYIDLKNKLIITEDLNEKGFSFLDNEYENITEKNKKMWKDCTNMNEFRFWCYILNCDDIDPMYKYDNCCFKDNKVYALDLRCIYIDTIFINITKEDFFMKYYEDYKGFLRNKIRAINTNKMDGYENTEQYKIWDESIKNFDDFKDKEKFSINEKIIKLIYYIVGIFKDDKIKLKENLESKNYLSKVGCNIMNFLQFYICKYKKKYTKFEYNGDTLEKQYNYAEYKINGYSYGKANGIFKKLIDDNKLDFEYFLTSDTLVKLYDIYRKKPDELFSGYITTDVNELNI